MSDSPTLPDLSIEKNDNQIQFTLPSFNSEHDFLVYDWQFTNCAEFCQTFGIKKTALLHAVFEKIELLAGDQNQSQIFERLYLDQNTPLFIKKIIDFPEFKAYLSTHNVEHCHTILNQRLKTCAQSKKQLANIVALFKTQPTAACLALIRFTHSVEALPDGDERNQLRWLLIQTKQAWYKENFLIRHALNSPFLEEYLNTHPQWIPCVDFVLDLLKKQDSLSNKQWEELLACAHYNSFIFCETLSQSSLIHDVDLTLFNDFLIKHPEHLDDFLKLSQHHKTRFTVWSEWIKILPEHANIIIMHWQNHLPHLLNESSQSEKALSELKNALEKSIITLSAEHFSAFQALLRTQVILKEKSLTNREQDTLPENKRHLITELILLSSVKASCWVFGVGLYSPALVYELYNQKVAPKIGTSLVTETGFDSSFYGVYASVGKPFSGNRIFEYTANESFKQTFLNGFKLFKDAKAGKQYFEHLHQPKMSDAEFYTRVLAKP